MLGPSRSACPRLALPMDCSRRRSILDSMLGGTAEGAREGALPPIEVAPHWLNLVVMTSFAAMVGLAWTSLWRYPIILVFGGVLLRASRVEWPWRREHPRAPRPLQRIHVLTLFAYLAGLGLVLGLRMTTGLF